MADLTLKHTQARSHTGNRSKYALFLCCLSRNHSSCRAGQLSLSSNLPLCPPPKPYHTVLCQGLGSYLMAQKTPTIKLSIHPAMSPPSPSSCATCTQLIILYDWPSEAEHEKIILVFPGAGDLIQLSSVNQRKTSLAWHKSASPPQNLLSHTHKKTRSVPRNNLPSQPRCDDVSFLITNCLFMLQQLPRAANKWLK